MKVKSIELTNLKSFKQASVELSEGINLIVGENNSGKSTIIRALLNLQYERTFDKKDIRSLSYNSRTLIKLKDISEKDNLSFRHKDFPTEYAIGPELNVLWGITNSLQMTEQTLYTSAKNTIIPITDITLKAIDASGNDIPFLSFPRFSDNESQNNFIYPFLARRKTGYYDTNINQDQTYRVSEGLGNLAAKVLKIGNSSHPKSGLFKNLCEDILGFSVGVVSVEQHNGSEVGIYVDGVNVIPLRSMGEGVANIVGFIAILLTENNKLFLIEELENDIHPAALKKLLNLIIEKSSNNQFVVSTHSHIVMKYLGSVENSKILYIDWKPNEIGGVENVNIPTSTITEVENTPEKRIEVLDKLGYDFHDFELFESYLFLEESSAERVIRDFIIPNIIPSLYNRIKTIAAKGVDDLKTRVIDFERLFVFVHTNSIYYKKAWVIADGDDAGKNCITDIRKKFCPKWPEEHFSNFSNEAFEFYYPQKFKERSIEALSISNKKKKQEAKKMLIEEVMNWALINKDEAINEFQKSAKEVITLLQNIESKLNSK